MYMYMYMYHACTYMFMPFNFGACPTSSIAHAYNRTSLDRNIHIAKPGAKQWKMFQKIKQSYSRGRKMRANEPIVVPLRFLVALGYNFIIECLNVKADIKSWQHCSISHWCYSVPAVSTLIQDMAYTSPLNTPLVVWRSLALFLCPRNARNGYWILDLMWVGSNPTIY